MIAVVVIVGMALCTFLPRYLPLVLFERREPSARWKLLLGYVPPAVLAAIVAPALVVPGPSPAIRFSLSNLHLVCGVAAIALCAATKRLLLSSLVAAGAFFVLAHFYGGHP